MKVNSFLHLALVPCSLSRSVNGLIWKKEAKMMDSFRDIKASPDLNWVPCFQNFTCAVLEVGPASSNP